MRQIRAVLGLEEGLEAMRKRNDEFLRRNRAIFDRIGHKVLEHARVATDVGQEPVPLKVPSKDYDDIRDFLETFHDVDVEDAVFYYGVRIVRGDG